jgi:hypothetical protein
MKYNKEILRPTLHGRDKGIGSKHAFSLHPNTLQQFKKKRYGYLFVSENSKSVKQSLYIQP